MKKTMTFSRLSVGLLAGVMLVISGCSSSNQSAPSTTTPAPGKGDQPAKTEAQGPVTLTVWMGSWWAEKVPEIVSAYKKDYPNVTLKIETLPINGYLDKAISSELGGNSPDVLDLDITMLPAMAGKDMLETWDNYIKDLDVNDFHAGAWNGSKINGKMYGLPNRGESSVFFYNKTMFDEAGVSYPTDNWTQEDMLEMAKKITVAGKKYGVGIAASNSDPSNVFSSFSPVLWSYGGDFLNKENTEAIINKPEGVKAITFWTELYTKHKVVPEGSVNFALTKDVMPMFLNNQVAMMPNSSSMVDMLKKNPQVKWGMVLQPNKFGRTGGWSFTLPKSSKNKDAARQFVLWYMKPENMGKLNVVFPSRKSATNVPPWSEPEMQFLLSAAPYQKAMPAVAAWTEMQTVIVTELQKVLTGAKTPQQAADEMAKQMNALLKK
ncbi:ABC transporter substrate-binding protein [Paenibacillus radicis (ex Xue et al. 2023)]|uniref:Sugar ABC transporter substrate-binding protein n=1 Tax=Paenibacillus radicis (ex Xue et al. 2023) TaxID=2972489 RepID=A0ABT1YIN5_9BACL|nr:sugar ABC transporter substrate-binding protein [Paenibacillus radicis (ex Xue et al. 2023)]MCR8633039.1 sugar ABC transporter substrate-binding protein [Paenibacillus radicis (ex Xue et al. 2023)]